MQSIGKNLYSFHTNGHFSKIAILKQRKVFALMRNLFDTKSSFFFCEEEGGGAEVMDNPVYRWQFVAKNHNKIE